MNYQDKLKEIDKTVTDAIEKLKNISLRSAENGTYFEEMEDCIFQLGYIKGLSYVSEV